MSEIQVLMKINGKLQAYVCGQNGKILTPLQEGGYETWTNRWECLGLHSEFENQPLVLEVSVSEGVLGKREGENFLGAILYTKDWPASRQRGEIWTRPNLRGLVYEGFQTFYTDISWRQNKFVNLSTDSSSNNLCVVEVGKKGFQTHEFCVVTDGEYVFLAYNITYHGKMFVRDGLLFVPDLQRKNIVSPNTLEALQWRVDVSQLKRDSAKDPDWRQYQCWAEQIDYLQLEENEAVVIAMATPIGSFYLRDRDRRHVTSSIREIHTPPGDCPFPTVGLVCTGVFGGIDQRLVLNNVTFYEDSEKRYGDMNVAAAAVIPDMGVPEESLIRESRRPRSRRTARMVLPESPNLAELERAVWGENSSV